MNNQTKPTKHINSIKRKVKFTGIGTGETIKLDRFRRSGFNDESPAGLEHVNSTKRWFPGKLEQTASAEILDEAHLHRENLENFSHGPKF